MIRLLDSLDTTRGDSTKDIHFALGLGRLFDSIAQGEKLREDTRLHLEEMEEEYLLPDLARHLEAWYRVEDFVAAQEALSLLQDGIDGVVDNNWLQVATQYHHRLISLKAGLGGHDASDEMTKHWTSWNPIILRFHPSSSPQSLRSSSLTLMTCHHPVSTTWSSCLRISLHCIDRRTGLISNGNFSGSPPTASQTGGKYGWRGRAVDRIVWSES